MFFSIYSINIISLYIILLLYYESKNLNLFKFYLIIADIDIIDIINELYKSSKDDYTIIIASNTIAQAAYINYITILIIILRIASSFINNRNLISRLYMTSSAKISNVLRIIAEIIKAAKDLNRTNIFSIDNESY